MIDGEKKALIIGLACLFCRVALPSKRISVVKHTLEQKTEVKPVTQ